MVFCHDAHAGFRREDYRTHCRRLMPRRGGDSKNLDRLPLIVCTVLDPERQNVTEAWGGTIFGLADCLDVPEWAHKHGCTYPYGLSLPGWGRFFGVIRRRLVHSRNQGEEHAFCVAVATACVFRFLEQVFGLHSSAEHWLGSTHRG
jgi:hypothetical protein